jgi:curved DNA-binding protein CbpA
MADIKKYVHTNILHAYIISCVNLLLFNNNDDDDDDDDDRQFYALSLIHHPDHNRSDPNASSRFASISSAYHVLSNSAKRARYDRDNGILAHGHTAAGRQQHPVGSHSSFGSNLHNHHHHHHQRGSYVGSRPTSGLSKRRGPFRGPPPSFYAQGGYGSAKARPAKASSSSASSSSSSSSSSTEGASSAGTAGQSQSSAAEDDPISFIDRNPIPHFNARGHFRVQSVEDARRRDRKTRAAAAAFHDQDKDGGGEVGGSLMIRFLLVCGILIGAGTTVALFRGPVETTWGNSSSSSRSSGSNNNNNNLNNLNNHSGSKALLHRKRHDE